jgi:hypothetical protein
VLAAQAVRRATAPVAVAPTIGPGLTAARRDAAQARSQEWTSVLVVDCVIGDRLDVRSALPEVEHERLCTAHVQAVQKTSRRPRASDLSAFDADALYARFVLILDVVDTNVFAALLVFFARCVLSLKHVRVLLSAPVPYMFSYCAIAPVAPSRTYRRRTT